MKATQKQEMAAASAKANVKVSKQSIEPKEPKGAAAAIKALAAEASAKPKKARTVKDAAKLLRTSPKDTEVEVTLSAAPVTEAPSPAAAPMAEAPSSPQPKKASLKDIPKEVVKATKKLLKKKPAPAPDAPPVTPLTKLLTRHGFTYSKSVPADERTTAHGYVHEDGSGALFIHANVSPDVGAAWTIKRKDGTEMKGHTAKELAAALVPPPSRTLPAHVVTALAQLRRFTTITFVDRKSHAELIGEANVAGRIPPPPLSKTLYRLADLAGDANYKARLQLLKTLRQTDKVLVKESGVNVLVKEFYAALAIPEGSAAARASAFEAKAADLYKEEQRSANAVKTVEKAEIKEVLKKTAPERVVIDNKPLLPVAKKLSSKRQAAADEATKAKLATELAAKGVEVDGVSEDLKAKIALKRRQEECTPLAVPRLNAELYVNLDDVCLLENPDNGIAMMCLEKPNSQGAICVYNNGSRVAAGVLETEDLIKFRRLVSEDLIRDVNQLLHPITSGVIVTDVAQRYLTAVLEACKERIEMANEAAVKTKKFEAPVKTATKKAAAEAKPAKAAKKAPAKSAAPKAGRPSSDAKITVLEKANPYREGTKCYVTYDLLKKFDGKPVSAFRAALVQGTHDMSFPGWAAQPHGKQPAYITIG